MSQQNTIVSYDEIERTFTLLNYVLGILDIQGTASIINIAALKNQN
jgi:hypothetical protein